MGIISVEQADRLLWLGRYTERVYTTIRMYFQKYDMMIDEALDSYQDFCRMVDIPDIYENKDDFRRRYPFDAENPDSIISNLHRAYDNAVVLREGIGSEALAFIQLAIYAMAKAETSRAPLIEMQKVMDNILAFWGITDDQIDSEQIRNLIKAGKRMERVDLYARLGVEKASLVREVHRMIPRIERSGLRYDAEKLKGIKSLVEDAELDYYKIVSEVETVLL